MELRSATGIALGTFTAIAIGGLLPSLPFDLNQIHIVLIFVLVVVVAGAVGGLVAGVTTAVVAALAFDFWHTQPYQSLKVDSTTDIVTMLFLIVVGVVVGALSSWATIDSERADDEDAEIHRLKRVTQLVGTELDEQQLIGGVADELRSCLSVDSATYMPGPIDDTAMVLELGGSMDRTRYRHGPSGFILEDDLIIPVHHGGRVVGGFRLEGASQRGVPLDHRIVAAAMADLLGSALGRFHPVP